MPCDRDKLAKHVVPGSLKRPASMGSQKKIIQIRYYFPFFSFSLLLFPRILSKKKFGCSKNLFLQKCFFQIGSSRPRKKKEKFILKHAVHCRLVVHIRGLRPLYIVGGCATPPRNPWGGDLFCKQGPCVHTASRRKGKQHHCISEVVTCLFVGGDPFFRGGK